MKSITKLLSFAALLCVIALGVSACRGDDDVINDVQTYQMGFSTVNTSGAPLSESTTIIDAFYSALGTETSEFSLGKVDDAYVKSCCETATKNLSGQTFKGYYVMQVRRGTNVIYSAPFGTKK